MSVFGEHALPADRVAAVSFGALEVVAEVRPDEWRLSWRYGEERDVDELRTEPAGAPARPAALIRSAVDDRDRRLRIEPALPDGDLVMRTEPAIHVLPGARVALHVGTPLSLAFRTSAGASLGELCAVRLERTWFGRSVRDGEICLSMRSHARLDAGEIPARPHRAVTVLEVHNPEDVPFSLERLKLPMRHLALHRAADGRWWTDALRVELAADGARMTVSGAPARPGPLTAVAAPRRAGTPNLVLRALDALFSERP